MTKKQTLDLEKLTRQTINRLVKNPERNFSLFGLERVEHMIKPIGFGYVETYQRSKVLEKQYNELLLDEDFREREYLDIMGGVVNDTENYNEWASNVGGVISRFDPENLIFYVRNETPTIRSRIYIPSEDYYCGLTNEQIKVKYGEEMFERMSDYLGDITISVDRDGKMRTPKRDIAYAIKMINGERTHPEMWD